MGEYNAREDLYVTERGNIRIGYIDKRTEIHINGFSDIPIDLLRDWRVAIPEEGISQEIIPLKFEDEPETVLVPTGSFLMGSERGLGIPEWEITPDGQLAKMHLPAFRIGRYPVTNYQYWFFLNEKEKKSPPREFGWRNVTQPTEDQYGLPVSGVTWFEALAYCAWLYEKTGRPYTLPSEAQWEKAARGDDGRIYPWSNEWNPKYCNTESKKTPVKKYVEFKSVYECVDMVGNIREWTTTLWGEKRLAPLFRYPLKDGDKRDLLDVNAQVRRSTRGGAALPFARDVALRVARRGSELPSKRGFRNARIGFRVALNIAERRVPENE